MAMTEQERMEWRKKLMSITDEEFLAMSDTEFRARFRERCHHRLEIQTYVAAYRHKKLIDTQTDYIKRLMGLWEKRGLPLDAAEYTYAKKLIAIAEKLIAGESVDEDLAEYAWDPVTPEEKEIFMKLLYERRSVREFKDIPVPDELIDEILDAGLWAAHACNLQSIRYLVIREDKDPDLFLGSDIPGGPVHLVICQDMRCYLANQAMPERNILLDAGACGQNLVLAAHAVGLEGVWITFNDKIKDRLRNYFNLPDYISIVTYVDVGYGDQTPIPPYRSKVADHVLARSES